MIHHHVFWHMGNIYIHDISMMVGHSVLFCTYTLDMINNILKFMGYIFPSFVVIYRFCLFRERLPFPSILFTKLVGFGDPGSNAKKKSIKFLWVGFLGMKSYPVSMFLFLLQP